jgi:hypothetical protein
MMRCVAVILALTALCGAADARELQVRPKGQTPSIMVEEASGKPQRATSQKSTRSRARKTPSRQAGRGRSAVMSSPVLVYGPGPSRTDTTLRRQLELDNRLMLQRQRIETQQQIRDDFIRRDIERRDFERRFSAPVGSSIGCAPGSIRC